jgi:hypothetical protein
MTAGSRETTKSHAASLVLAVLLVAGWSPIDTVAPNPQDIQIAGRVLNFQETPRSGAITIAIVYNPADPRSRDEAAALAALLGNGLFVGALFLHPLLVEQTRLAEAPAYGAIFATIGVDESLLGAALKQRQVLCLTRHLEQVEHAACTVAIGSQPSVSIVVSQANAAIAGVRFATAFRMMVREI